MNHPTLIAAFCVALVVVACGEDPIKPEQAAPYVDAWAQTVEPELLLRSEGAPVIRALTTQIEAAAAKDKAAPTRDEPAYDVILEAVYKAREFKPAFVVGGELSPAGQSVWKILTEIEDHVLDPRDYPIAKVTELKTKLEAMSKGDSGGDLTPSEADKAEMVAFLTQKTPTEFALGEENYPKLTEQLLNSPAGTRLKDTMVAHTERGEKLAATGAELEYLLAHSLARFSYQIRYFRAQDIFIHKREDDYYNEPEIRKKRPDPAKAHYRAGVIWRHAAKVAKSMYSQPVYSRKHIKAMLTEVMSSDNPIEIVEGLEPQQPQYRPLVKEYRRYRKIAAAGGWEKVKKKKGLKVGSTNATVRALKERLKKEGYYMAAVDDTFDEALKAAITAYQETHQMKVSGTPHNVFWKSINIPVERRLEQIRINIKRWRNTNIRHKNDNIYAFVNVADFAVEIWENQNRALRHRVIVGNNDNVKNEETEEMERANRTPVPLAAYIDRVIYNPFWNVTPRVRKNEILPEVKTWLEAKYRKIIEANNPKPPPSLMAPTMPPTSGESGPLTPPTAIPPTPSTPPAAAPPTPTPMPATNTGLMPPPSLMAPKPTTMAEMPYYNAETGEIDPSTTDPENIPGWYAENNYEVMYAGKKWEYVRMTPGAHNALGFVKIIFPNLHDVYLHDTNARALFSRDIRAYSHGCMRLQNPLKLAEWLLRRDGLYEDAKVPAALKSGEYLPVFLKRQVPVFVEYYTVRVDDKGRANFLADVYKYDNDAKLPEPMVRKAAAP